MSLDKYLKTVRKLNNMGRWAPEFMHQRATVSEHSFLVAQIGQMLAIIEEEHGNKVNWERLFKKLINHDVVEALTGDILSFVKHRKTEMKKMVDIIEEEVAEEHLLSYMEEPYRSIYKNLMFDGKDETLEGQILRAADYIDALIECINELNLENCVPFEDKYNTILSQLKLVNLISAKYFLEDILPGLTSDCKKLDK
ncbi:HD domain-containing protein [Clostridium swellfunianum]|uniref:HD domain-containing protein n=1 Tax=Clostridium swellfunianum TaxID=1367462 RepID=UPI002030BA49|nr:HD domain-containing protein [Clostridium swellfunianum]MCM0646828.1 HD domain-containing protein [Clostridium swellfunianum]